MTSTLHLQQPPPWQYCYLLPVTQYFFKRSNIFPSSLTFNHSRTKKEKGCTFSRCQVWGHWAACASFTSHRGCHSSTHATHAQPHTHTRPRWTGHGCFSSVYCIEPPWHWGLWLHHRSPKTGWHTTLIFQSGGISEWRHRTVHETPIRVSNVYFSTAAQCGVTARCCQVNTVAAAAAGPGSCFTACWCKTGNLVRRIDNKLELCITEVCLWTTEAGRFRF